MNETKDKEPKQPSDISDWPTEWKTLYSFYAKMYGTDDLENCTEFKKDLARDYGEFNPYTGEYETYR